MKDYLLYCILVPCCYLIGSINFAVLISTLKNKDIKSLGSGNPGTMNMIRSMGKIYGIITFLLDFAKGVLSALLGMFLFKENPHLAMYVLGFTTVIGHIFSIFCKFKGGKGVATTLGAFSVISPIAFGVCFIVLLLYLKFFKKGFIGSIIAISIPIITEIIINAVNHTKYEMFYIPIILCAIWLILIIFTHKSNIIRLINGEENSLNLYEKEDKVNENNEGGTNEK